MEHVNVKSDQKLVEQIMIFYPDFCLLPISHSVYNKLAHVSSFGVRMMKDISMPHCQPFYFPLTLFPSSPFLMFLTLSSIIHLF